MVGENENRQDSYSARHTHTQTDKKTFEEREREREKSISRKQFKISKRCKRFQDDIEWKRAKREGGKERESNCIKKKTGYYKTDRPDVCVCVLYLSINFPSLSM